MSKFFNILWVILALYLSISIVSCDDDENILTCTVKANYRGTTVCHQGENAAAVEVEATGEYIILENFFELQDPNTITYGDVVYLDYNIVDTSLVSSGALCGVAIIAPIAHMTCVSSE